MRHIAICLILLAGCAGPVTETPDVPEAEPVAATNETAPPPRPTPAADPGPQEAPWDLLVKVSSVNGTAPLNVTFRLAASRAVDNVTWSIDFGDASAGGDGLPADVWHVFEAGNRTVEITAATALREVTRSVTLTVAPAPLPPPPVVTPFTASIPVGVPYQSGGPAPGQAAFVWTSYEEGAPWTRGTAFTVPIGTVNMTIATRLLAATVAYPADAVVCGKDDPIAPDADLFLFRSDGTFIQSSGACGTGEEIFIDAPAYGDYIAIVWGFLGANMEVPGTISIQPPQRS